MKRIALSVAFVAAFALAGHADDIRVTSASVPFSLDTTGEALSVGSVAEISSLCPVAWCKGETVTVIAPDGTETTLAENAASAGSVRLTSSTMNSGGFWRLVNSALGTAIIGVPWSVFGDGGALVTSGAQTALLDTAKDGPDRRINYKQQMPIAYSGDDWIARDSSATSTLTVTPPNGVAATAYSLTGTGVQPFAFNDSGKWTVVLAREDGSTRTAVISVSGGLAVILK